MQVDLVDEVVSLSLHLIAAAVPSESIGIRLRDRNCGADTGPFPLVGQIGFSERFVRDAMHCYRAQDGQEPTLRCLCGAVLEDHPIARSPAGSFWETAFDAERLAALLPADQTSRVCLDEGIGSMALVPLREDGKSLGLIHAADRRPGALDLVALGKLEKIAGGLVRLLAKVRELDRRQCQRGASSFHVLIAEDDLQVQGVMVRMLSRAGYRCCAANDGVKAYELLQAERFDLLVTDLDMPRMGGLELIKKIREHYGPYGPPIIVSSGSAALGQLSAERLQVAAILAKPFASLHELQDVVAQVLPQ